MQYIEELCRDACRTGERLPRQYEMIIAKNPEYACHYAQDVIKGAWVECEPAILQSPRWTYQYARKVIKGRWVPGELILVLDPFYAYMYASELLHQRWLFSEQNILQVDTGKLYIQRFRKDRESL